MRKQLLIKILCGTICILVMGAVFYTVGLGKNGFLAKPILADVVEEVEHVEQSVSAFSHIYYYEQALEQRYGAYQQQHPELSVEDIVWQVNVNLDKPFYSEIQMIEDTSQLPLIVNKYNQLPEDYVPDQLVTLTGKYLATQETKEAYDAMYADAEAQGYRLRVASAYRSISYQKDLYNRYLNRDKNQELVDTYSARPGHSEHHTGRAIDFAGPSGKLKDFISTPEAQWVYDNSYQYGFIVRYQQDIEHLTGYQYEPWHVVYVGKEVSMAMHQYGIGVLEEYVVKYIDHTPPETMDLEDTIQ